jgi:hypothetical protein
LIFFSRYNEDIIGIWTHTAPDEGVVDKSGTVSKDLAAPGTRKHGIQGAPELLTRQVILSKHTSLEATRVLEGAG